MILDIPRFKCQVEAHFLSNGTEKGYVDAYCFAVTLIEARPIMFTVHTVHGAIYSRLPIWALRQNITTKTEKKTFYKSLDQWGAISSTAQVIKHAYLKDYSVKAMPLDMMGTYWFTIDYFGEDFSQDPEQSKTSNIIMLDNGQICAMPNNMCLFQDRHFTDNEKPRFKYKRSLKYHHLD